MYQEIIMSKLEKKGLYLMKDFIYEGHVKIIYGAGQMDYVLSEIKNLGQNVLVVPAPSFVRSGNFKVLKEALTASGLLVKTLENINGPMLSKVKEGVSLCTEENIEVVIGIGGGVCLDLAKAIAFGAKNTSAPMESYLTYELSTEGLSSLPVITIPTNPMSGSETNADVQITFDENGLQAGCGMVYPTFTWLNPEYVMSLPAKVLAYGQMTAFVQLSLNYLNLTRSMLAEHFAEASMKTVLSSLRISLNTDVSSEENKEARGTLLLNSALSLSGINDLGRDFEFIPYPLQSFAQRYLGLNYPEALTGLFPYWMKTIYRASADKSIFYRYFEEILNISISENEKTNPEVILQKALSALFALYKEFGIATSYGELAKNPENREELLEIIRSFGPMTSHFMTITDELLADIIEDAIIGNVNSEL